MLGMPGRATPGCIRGYPQRTQTQRFDPFDLCQRSIDVLQRCHRDPNQTRVCVTKRRHGAIVSGRRTVGDVIVGRSKDEPRAQRGKHHLFSKTEQVKSLAALLTVECTKRIVPLRPLGQVVTQRDQPG